MHCSGLVWKRLSAEVKFTAVHFWNDFFTHKTRNHLCIFVAPRCIAPEIIAISHWAWFNLAVYYVATWHTRGHKHPICGPVKSPQQEKMTRCSGDVAESSWAVNLDKWERGDPPRCSGVDFLLKIGHKIFMNPIIYSPLITDSGLRIYFPRPHLNSETLHGPQSSSSINSCGNTWEPTHLLERNMLMGHEVKSADKFTFLLICLAFPFLVSKALRSPPASLSPPLSTPPWAQ